MLSHWIWRQLQLLGTIAELLGLLIVLSLLVKKNHMVGLWHRVHPTLTHRNYIPMIFPLSHSIPMFWMVQSPFTRIHHSELPCWPLSATIWWGFQPGTGGFGASTLEMSWKTWALVPCHAGTEPGNLGDFGDHPGYLSYFRILNKQCKRFENWSEHVI